MPFNQRQHLLRTILGWLRLTPVEIGLLVLIAGMVYFGGIPRYQAWKHTNLLEDEQRVVAAIRGRLANMTEMGLRRPTSLDSTSEGPAGTDRPFFGAVLTPAVTDIRWSRVGTVYHGPAGGMYEYDPVIRHFVGVSTKQPPPTNRRTNK